MEGFDGPGGKQSVSVAFSDEYKVFWLPTPPARPAGRDSSLADETGTAIVGCCSNG